MAFYDLYEALLPEVQEVEVVGSDRPPSDYTITTVLPPPHPSILTTQVVVVRNVGGFALPAGISRVMRRKLEALLVLGLDSAGVGHYHRLRHDEEEEKKEEEEGWGNGGTDTTTTITAATTTATAIATVNTAQATTTSATTTIGESTTPTPTTAPPLSKMLRAKGLLYPSRPFKDSFIRTMGSARDWPDGRGYYYHHYEDDNCDIAVWINEEDHVRIVGRKEGGGGTGAMVIVARRVLQVVEVLEGFLKGKGLGFMRHERLGFVTSSPESWGTGMRITVGCHMPQFRCTPKTKIRIKKEMGLGVLRDTTTLTTINVTNTSTLSHTTEAALVLWMEGQMASFLEKEGGAIEEVKAAAAIAATEEMMVVEES